MKIEKIKYITRAYVRQNRSKMFLFGDNLKQAGFGGQAKAMRGEVNALGIPTKKSPGMMDKDFFTDKEYEENVIAINNALNRLKYTRLRIVVIPEDGIGTGLAELDKRAPKTFAYLQKKLLEIIDL